MRIVIILCCVWLASAGIFPEKYDRVKFNGKYYDKEVLINMNKAFRFSLDETTNTLFFTYWYPEYRITMISNHIAGIAYYNIDTNEFQDLPEVIGGTTTGINPKTGDVYLGSKYGIYKYNSMNKTAVPYAAKGVNIHFLYYSTLLYYTTFPDYHIYSYDGKETKKVSNIEVNRFIGDKEKYFFHNSTGLYRVLDNKEENAEKFSAPFNGGYQMFAKDNNNNIFVTGRNRVYTPNEEKKKFDKIADIKGIMDLVFDQNNNIIYSDKKSICRLTPSEATCPKCDSV